MCLPLACHDAVCAKGCHDEHPLYPCQQHCISTGRLCTENAVYSSVGSGVSQLSKLTLAHWAQAIAITAQIQMLMSFTQLAQTHQLTHQPLRPPSPHLSPCWRTTHLSGKPSLSNPRGKPQLLHQLPALMAGQKKKPAEVTQASGRSPTNRLS